MSWLDENDWAVDAGTSDWWVPDTAGDQEFMDFMSGAAGDAEFEQFMADAAASGSANEAGSIVKSAWDKLGDSAVGFLKQYLYNPTTGKFNAAGLGTAAAALGMLAGKNNVQTGGYSKPIPKYEAVREQVQYNDPNRRPGEAGRQYFTDTQYAPQGDTAAAQATVAAQKQGLAAAYQPKAAPAAAAPAAPYVPPWERVQVAAPQTPPPAAASGVAAALPIPQAQGLQAMAQGGIAGLAHGGRYLAGNTDGMADEIPTSIDGKDPAALSHGEFVIPADVVSHLGNGNSEAGAEKLYSMMAKIRKARTGTTEQGKEIDADKFMPGGLAGYAAGGSVKAYAAGDLVTGSNTTAAPTATTPTSGFGTSTSSSLSPWAGDYVTNYLGQGAAAAAAPYQAYQGPLTAGASNLQQQAFAGASSAAGAGYTPTQFSGGLFDAAAAKSYMNPYLESALAPQLEEARRQAQITRLGDATRLTQAGAFGGSRQAIMESELNRNLMTKQNELLGQGYSTAYDKAMGQFNADQGRQMDAQKATEGSRQFSANYGLLSVNDLAKLGEAQRAIAGEGIAADKAQFEEQRDWMYKMPQYQKDLLQGLPITTNATTNNTTQLGQITGQIADLQGLYDKLAKLGQTTPTA
jgi:hypothetical protein